MSIYSDSEGFYYLGNALYGNNNLNFPSVNYLRGHPYSSLSSELTDLVSTGYAGLKVSSVLSQSALNSNGDNNIIDFSSKFDTINNRFGFDKSTFFNIYGYTTAERITMVDDDGSTIILRLNRARQVTTSPYFKLSSRDSYWSYRNTASDITERQCVGASNGEYLALFLYQKNLTTGNIVYDFYYAGSLKDVNTNENGYFSNNIKNYSVLISTTHLGATGVAESPDNSVGGFSHYNGIAYLGLESGDADFNIICADAQTPTGNWATECHLFMDRSDLGYPRIGTAQGLLLAQGSFTIGKPVRISGGVFPDTGSNNWLPVGNFANKTILMRCYSDENS